MKITMIGAALAAGVSLLLAACSSGNQITNLPSDNRNVSVSVLDVGQQPTVEVSCIDLLSVMCEVEWSGNETWDDAIIYRNTVNDPSTATQVARVWSAMGLYFDRNVVSGTRYYYWVVFEDRSGQRSPQSVSATACAAAFGQSCAPATPPSTADTDETDDAPDRSILPFQREAGETPYQSLKQPRLVTEASQAPVYHDGVHLFVGIDQGSDKLSELEEAGVSSSASAERVVTPTGSTYTQVQESRRTVVLERGEWTLRHASVSETRGHGSAADRLADYLNESAQIERIEDGVPLVLRFTSPPLVRFGGAAATAADVDRLVRAVQIVNASLPMAWRMEMPSGVPEDAPVPEDGIYVEFLPSSSFFGNSLGSATTAWLQDGSIPHATITINKGYRAHDEDGALHVLVHELIHALGLGHVSDRFQSVMTPTLHDGTTDTPLSILYPIDRAALRALYGRMEAGHEFNEFGAWDDNSTYLLGNSDHVAFGAVWRNGYAEPWAYGYLPDTDLGDNPTLAGWARWNGLLLGFTPTAESVTGDATLGVNLTDLTGNASFTRLETWTVGEVPGNAGFGTLWGDGNLHYGIVVTGNTFTQTGGDEGLVTGAFFGASHEGMGGVLERSDLSAAFGGHR